MRMCVCVCVCARLRVGAREGERERSCTACAQHSTQTHRHSRERRRRACRRRAPGSARSARGRTGGAPVVRVVCTVLKVEREGVRMGRWRALHTLLSRAHTARVHPTHTTNTPSTACTRRRPAARCSCWAWRRASRWSPARGRDAAARAPNRCPPAAAAPASAPPCT